MRDKTSHQQVMEQFALEGFRTGPHKGFQIARDAQGINLFWYTDLPEEMARRPAVKSA